jgi:hypothetical protein
MAYEEEVQTLRNDLISKEQQIEDQSEINRFKTKQYSYLVKQILKGLLIDPENF